MNEDFGNNNRIDAELQVRLMNLVMGEASDFERDQLQVLMEQRADLAAYYQHLEHLHGLLCEVGAGEPWFDVEASNAEDSWQLSPDRRKKVLAVLDGKAQDTAAKVILAGSTSTKLKSYLSRRWLATLAVAAASLLLGLMMFPRGKLGRGIALSERTRNPVSGLTPHTIYLDIARQDKAPEAPDTFVPDLVGVGQESLQAKFGKTEAVNATPMRRSVELAPSAGVPNFQYYNRYSTGDFQNRSGYPGAPNAGFVQPGSPPPAPAMDANGSAIGNKVNEPLSLNGQTDRFDRSLLSDMASNGRWQAESTTDKPGSGFGGGMDGGMGGTAGGMGGMSGGGMGGMGDGTAGGMAGGRDGMAGRLPGGGMGEGGDRQASMDESRALARGESAYGPADDNLAAVIAQVDQSGQASSVEKFGLWGRFGDLAKSAATTNQPGFGNEQPGNEQVGNSLSWSIEAPKTELGERVDLYDAADGEPQVKAGITVTVPDGGSIMLGGIQRNRSEEYFDRSAEKYLGPEVSTLMQTVTPRIVIAEEEVRLGVAQAEPGRFNLNTVQEGDLLEDLYGANETPSVKDFGIAGTEMQRAKETTRSFGDKLDSLPFGGATAPVTNPTEEQLREPSARTTEERGLGSQAEGFTERQVTRGSESSAGSMETAKIASGLLGDVQTEVVDSDGAIIGKGGKRDVERTLETIDLIKQQGLQELTAEQSKRVSGVDAESQANSEWYRNQVGAFQAANEARTREQLAELKDEREATKDEPKAADAGVDFLKLPRARGVESAESIKLFAEPSKRVAPEIALQESVSTSEVRELSKKDNISPASPESAGLEKSLGWVDNLETKSETAAGRRFRSVPEPAIAGKPVEGKLPEIKIAATAATPNPAESSGPEMAQTDLKSTLSRSERRPSIDEQSAAKEAFSTFSLHVSDVSFKLAQTALSQGQWPEAAKIRIEEFVNALDYRDPLPSGNEKVACRVEQAIHPFLIQRNMLRVSMRTAATGRSQNTPLRLTILLDNSGSMERPDRRQAVLRAFQTLTTQLKAVDQVTLISFASTPRLLADKVPGNQGETLLQLIENLPSEGGTNIEAALMLAREKAAEQQLSGAQNRIVLLTDGAVNLGNANPNSLAKLVTQLRDSGIAFDAAGISAQDLNDEVLEALTRQGDGRYYLLDSAEAANESFAAQIAGALRPSAQNVKVQVEFNPQRVGRYKLLGFEKHRLNKEDFRNDNVDAAEMAAAEAGVAVYQFEIKPNGSGDVGSVSVRFRDLTTGKMVENRWPIPYESNAPRIEKAEPSMQLAACSALFAAKLGGGPLGDSVDLAQLQKLLANLPEQAASQPRVQQLRAMVEQAVALVP